MIVSPRQPARGVVKITGIETFTLRAPLEEPFAYSQWRYTHRETTLVEVRTSEGITGWGEAYSPSPPVVAAIDRFLGPLIMGRDPRDVEDLWQFLYARGLDYGPKGTLVAALSALDIAFWDIKSKAANVPLYRLLGGAMTSSVPCYATGFYFCESEPLERRFAKEAESYASQGFTAMKVKVGLGVERDAGLVELVRRTIGPRIGLMIDANHAYDPVTAVALGRRIEHLDITWFEEPVSPLDPDGYLEVKAKIAIPLAGGECEFTRFGFEPWFRKRAIDYAQPDLCACGGITEGMKIATLASLHQVHVTPHAWGSAIGQAAALHFYAARPKHPGTLTAERKLIECDRSENPFRTQIAANPVRLERGSWLLPEGPGLGVEIDRAAVERFRSTV